MRVVQRVEPKTSAPPQSGTRTIQGASEELEETDTLLRRVAETIPGMSMYWDRAQRCRFANPACEEWFGERPGQLIDRTLEDLLGSSYWLNQPYIEAALRGEEQSFEREIHDPVGGPSRHTLTRYVPDVVNGAVQGFAVVVSDITAERNRESVLPRSFGRARVAPALDDLTGLPDRVAFEDHVSCAIENAERNALACGVLFLELHDFKKLTDTFDVAAGDDVVREVGRRLSESLRGSDTVSRAGGSDFMVLLPESDAVEAGIVARKLLRVMAEEPFDVRDRALPLSFSVGIAMYTGNGVDATELIARADSALYDARRTGEDRIAYFTATD